ncbi:TetR/AcrR family transcriptional regulator [Adhaeribacter sp. BT258]|uniref:TetR/AcrR family transcriptional regulator n=1 Tax=Adhaeribacter terrigena TaxID=2793070 RepID=A0ABS1C498_9BACT|nr:TetR/AcrR family transcriptional regulator [Adhaeribacter terrigena]MBK0404230.1 TetR/AcrR family transcriptional regulator [Adhaeribacter terrigena]
MDVRTEILDKAITWFYQNGVKDLTESRICAQLQISEQTFPQVFRDKEDLVHQAVEYSLNAADVFPAEVMAAAQNPVEEIILMFKSCADQVKDVHPGFFIQIQYLYPSAWNTYQRHLQINYYYQFYDLLNEGIRQKLFRHDINLEIVTKVLIEQLNVMHNTHLFPKHRYNMGEVFRNIFLNYLRGICTETGSQIADAFFSDNTF